MSLQNTAMPVQEDFWDYFWFAKLYLRAAGILPIGGTPSLWKSIFTRLLSVLPLFYGTYLIIPEINYILFQRPSMDNLFKALTIAIAIIGGQFRSIFVALHGREITRLFSICEKLWDNTIRADYEVILIWGQRARLFSTTYFCLSQFSTTTFFLTTTAKQILFPENSTMRYYPFHYPEDSTPSPQYEIKYTLQVIIAYVGHSFVVAADMTGTLLALNMCGQLALIRSWLLNISKEESTFTSRFIDESLKVELKKCTRRHQLVLDFCAELEEIVRYINLAQIITGMYLLAISGARLTKSLESNQYVGPILFAISGLFLSCWPADNLISVSNEVAQAVYGVPWYNFSPHGKTTVAIMIARSQRSAKLTAGRFGDMSLETFSSIVSSGISFCMVLNSF